MILKLKILIIPLIVLVFTIFSPVDSFSLEFQPVLVDEINLKTLRGATRINVVSNSPYTYYETDEFEEPYTLIVSIPEAELSFTDERYMVMPVKSPNIKEIRVHQFYDYLASPQRMLRIIVEFKQKSNYKVIFEDQATAMNIDVEITKSEAKKLKELQKKERLVQYAINKAREKELREVLKREKNDRILAKHAKEAKDEAIRKRRESKKEIIVEGQEVKPKKKSWFSKWKEKRQEAREKKLEAKRKQEMERVLVKAPVKKKQDEIIREQEALSEDKLVEPGKEKIPPHQKLAQASEKPPSVEELVRSAEDESKLIGSPTSPGAKKEEAKPKKKITSLEQCIDIGLENHMPAKISLDEVKLAELKVAEARRALFPSASFKKVRTDGDIYDVGFLEREYILRLEQPLYYGGRLRDAIKKAQLNLEISKRNYNKVKAEFVAKVEAAFYSFVGAQTVLAAQEELKAEAEHILGIAKRRYDKGLSTEVEYLNIQHLYAQILYQINVAQMEMGSAKLQLEHALDLDSSYEIEIKETLQYAKIDIDLEESLKLAFKNRPSLFINELTVRVNEIEEKIVRNKNRFKVDLTGSYGQGGGAYKSEKLTLDKTWYAGVMFTKPLGGNTLSYHLSEDETAPRLGQTTRTGSHTQTWEFSILNNIARYSEERSAKINLKKALNELNEIKKSISSEVREAFFRYEKAIMQVDGSVVKIQLRQKEIEVNQARVDVDEAHLSELLESKIRLTDEKVAYFNAISSYYSAVSGINKAIGLSSYYSVETPPGLPEKTKEKGKKEKKKT